MNCRHIVTIHVQYIDCCHIAWHVVVLTGLLSHCDIDTGLLSCCCLVLWSRHFAWLDCYHTVWQILAMTGLLSHCDRYLQWLDCYHTVTLVLVLTWLLWHCYHTVWQILAVTGLVTLWQILSMGRLLSHCVTGTCNDWTISTFCVTETIAGHGPLS